MDFADLKAIVQPIIDDLDHRNLDELDELPNSTSEMLAKYIWDRLSSPLPLLSAVTIWESDTSRCIYRGT
jgi:6-pyruvoyltetrahydropterin/6-carboxytetrahydropterin synthase